MVPNPRPVTGNGSQKYLIPGFEEIMTVMMIQQKKKCLVKTDDEHTDFELQLDIHR